jgi:hypothetical protein
VFARSELHDYLVEEAELERAQQHRTEEGEPRRWRMPEEDAVDQLEAAGLVRNHNGRTVGPTIWLYS